MLIVFRRPIDRQANFATEWHLFEDLATEPFGKIFGFEPWVMNQPRELFGSGFLISMPARQVGLIASLFLNDRQDELAD